MKTLKTMVCKALFMCGALLGVMSCSSGSDDYLTSLPDSPAVICKMDVATMVKNADLANNPSVQKALAQMDGQGSGMAQLLKLFLQNPDETGVDFSKPVMLAQGEGPEGSGAQSCVVFPVRDAEKMVSILQQLAKNIGPSAKFGKVKDDDELVISDDHQACVMTVNATRMVVMTQQVDRVENMRAIAHALLNKVECKDLDKMRGYQQFNDSKQEVACLVDLQRWAQVNQMDQLVGDTENSLASSAALLSFQFEKGKIQGTCQWFTDEANEQRLSSLFARPEGMFNAYMPEKPIFCAYYSMKHVDDLNQLLPVALLDAANESLEEFGFGEKALSLIEGDVMVALSKGYPSPNYILCLSMRNRSAFDSFAKNVTTYPGMARKVDNDTYLVVGDADFGGNFYVQWKEGALVVQTVDSYKANAARKVQTGKALPEVSLPAVYQNGASVLYVNNLQEMVRAMLLNKADNASDLAKAAAMMGFVKQMEWCNEGVTKSGIELQLNDTEQNALAAIVEYVFQTLSK